MPAGQFVCAFRGARDGYQAAVALAEGGLLDQLITDAYATAPLRALAALAAPPDHAVHRRHAAGLPDHLVRSLWGTTVVEHARHRLGYAKRVTWLTLDRRFSLAAAARARRTGSDLLLYSPYAIEAFQARYPRTPKRVLFQYHPHPAMEARILADDQRAHPGFGESFTDGHGDAAPELVAREGEAWRHADLVICSSAFTKQSLIEAGCAAGICHVLPYGVDSAPVAAPAPHVGLRALFVGSGGQRKGLHHLLLAWQRAAMGKADRLVLVCRAVDRGIEAMAAATFGVELIRGASPRQLEQLYGDSDLFVMPSLVEGFGHVYLEALSRGCPVLGTANSCLPDIGGEADGVFRVPAGDIVALSACLADLSRRRDHLQGLRPAARATAARYPWSAFRAGLRAIVQS